MVQIVANGGDKWYFALKQYSEQYSLNMPTHFMVNKVVSCMSKLFFKFVYLETRTIITC